MSSRLEFLIDTLQDNLNLGRSIAFAKTHLLRGGFSEEEIDLAIREIQLRTSNSKSNSVSVLRNDPQHQQSWYRSPSLSPGSHWNLLKEYLQVKKNWSAEMVASLDAGSTAVVGNLAAPFGSDNSKSKGLVVGYVQSGKTANFSAVIAKAIDAGYRMIIVLAGMHNNLRLQTEKRLFHEICEPDLSSCTNLTAIDENGDFKRTQTTRAERACGRQDGFSIAVLKKNARVLRNFDLWLSEANPKTVTGCPTLIIDDESDHASVNTARPEEDPTAINNLIRSVIRRFGIVSYVGYTATPFANVLINAAIEDDLYPRDFLVNLDRPSGYLGARELFGGAALGDAEHRKGLPIVRIVPITEVAGLRPSRKQKAAQSAGANLPTSLVEAITSFILAGALRLSRQQHRDHITMLIHCSHLTAMQEDLYEKVKLYIDGLRAQVPSGLPTSLAESIHELYLKDFAPTSSQLGLSDKVDLSVLKGNAVKFIQRLEIVIDNSNSDDRLSFDRDSPLWGIVVGGNTLSRGLTIEGLTISYFVRDAKGYDTLMQMGRWFGYRPGYADLTRLFVTEDLHRKFFHLSSVEEEFRDEIRAMSESGDRPIDVALRIRSHPTMVVTSNLKAQTAVPASLSFSGTKIQARYLNLTREDVLKKNQSVVLSTVERLLAHSQPGKSRFADFAQSLLWRGVSPEIILQFLDGYEFSPANIRFTNQLLKRFIIDSNEGGELGSWSVAVIGSGSGSAVELARGVTINSVQRSVLTSQLSERDPSAVYLTALSPPEDELIDLDDLATSGTSSTQEFIKRAGNGASCSGIRRTIRPTERPLLLLYPLERTAKSDPQPEAQGASGSQGDFRLTALLSPIDVFGVAFVFPKNNRSERTYRYIINGTV